MKKKIFFNLFILAVLGLRCCAGFPLVEASGVSSCGARASLAVKQGL